jgi:tripartite-type tricarboxylate transporter receptor subunit TctC
MLTKMLKLPVKIVTGYKGTDDVLAMRRGEIKGTVASRSSWEVSMKNGYGRFIVQIGGTQTDVPQLAPQVSDPDARAMIALIQSQGDIARLTAGPPGIPADRLSALREAYKKAMEDPELQMRAEKFERPVEPAYGDDVLKMVQAAMNQSPATIALLKEAMDAK